MTIHFYKAHDDYGFMSNFYEAPIVIDGELWRTTEHYYQAQKFEEGPKRYRIKRCSTPNEAAVTARRLRGIVDDWDEIKYRIMYLAVLNKFTQHLDLMRKLLETGDEGLVEHTVGTIRPDPWWGDGADGTGRNWLGKILMQVRSVLRHNLEGEK